MNLRRFVQWLLIVGLLIPAAQPIVPAAAYTTPARVEAVSTGQADPTTTALCRALEPEAAPMYQLFLPLIQRSGSTVFAAEIDRGADHTLDLPLAHDAPLQSGVLTDTIDPQRAATLRGQVCDRSGTLLSGVSISVLDHPEYGSTLTDAQGQYTLIVNGGQLLTLDFAKTGYFPAQRKIQAAWQAYDWLADVALVPPDANVTTIDLTLPQMQAARGSAATDADGTRQATVLFSAGTQAELVLANGVTQTLTTLNVRATEYTVGERGPAAMPGELPPASGYTYALEYSVDEALAAGATDVRFSKPVLHYVENFLDFPVGSLVPTGYYDREKGLWIASENGRVVKVVSITNGLANVDTDGDDVADNGSVITPTMTLTITIAERQQLAALYQPGQTLWRVPLTHFTPWDCNWPFGPPDDARAPNQPRPNWSPTPERECQRRGSIIACQSQTLGEVAAVPGTPYELSYSSNRVPGHSANRTILIPLSVGTSLPASLRRIEVQIFIAGRRIDRTFAPTPNQVYTFVWDGMDANGQVARTGQAAIIRVGYTYGAVYLAPDKFNRAFGAFGGEITRVRARQEVTLGHQDEVMVSNPDARRVGLGGWNLSRHHVYDPASSVLYLGDGTQRSANADSSLITTVAGNGSSVPTGDGVPATSVAVIWPVATDIDADGNLYVVAAGSPYQRIRRIDTSGIITTVAGAGVGGQDKDGIPATQAVLVGVADVALGPDGSLYLAQYSGVNRVRRIDANGIITTVAGTGYTAYNGDGLPATSANLHDPSAIALGADGNLYIAETFGYRIRAVGPDGLIRTVAGTGVKGLTGDGGPATQAQIGEVRGLDVGPDGSLYFTDSAYHVVRRIGPDGIISTLPIAGANAPWGLDADANGQVYFTEYSTHRVRRIGTDGAVVTLAGTGTYGYSGDGLQATRARLNQPYGVLAAPDGAVYVADLGNHRVRRIGALSLSGLNPDESLIAAEDGSEVYVFDLTGSHLRTLDGVTGALIEQFAYDGAGRLISVTDAFSNTTIIQHATNGQPIGLVAPGGQHTQLATDANGYLASITYPTGEAITFTSSSDGLLTSLTTPRGGTAHFAYAADGRLIRDENAAGGVTTLDRTSTTNGYHVSITSPLSRTTVYAVGTLTTTNRYRARIDPNGGLTSVTARSDGTTTTIYPDGTQVDVIERPDPRWGMAAAYPEAITVTLPGGMTTTQTISRAVTLAVPGNPFSVEQITTRVQHGSATAVYTYTAANRTITSTTATGVSSIAQLDALGRIISVTLAPGQTSITYTYNSLGQLIETRQGAQAWTYAYDAAQQLIGRSNAAGEDQRYGYDLTGRMISTTLPNDRALNFGYDDNGQLDQVVMPGGAIHTLNYNALNQQAGYTAPGNPALTSIFNADRSLASVTLPGGRTLTRTYDDGGRVTGMAYPEASTTFGYNVDNLMDRVDTLTRTPTAGAAQVISYTYQGELPTSLTWSGAAQGAFTYTYNSRLSLTNLRLLSGLDTISTTLAYDADGQAITYGPFTLTRNGPGRAISQLRDGTLTTTLTYDSVARPISWTQHVKAQRPYQAQYTYDLAGRIAQQIEIINGSAVTRTYTYNGDGSLAQVTRNGVTVESYDYDLNGNRTSRQINGGSIEAATYDAQDRLQTLGSVAYHFDVDGFMDQRGADRFRYTARGELISATINGQTSTYAYDALNRLVARTDANGTTQYLYGNPSNPYQVLAARSAAGVLTYFYYDDQGRVFAFERGGARYYVATDQVGSPRVIADANGQIVRAIEYDSFGNIVIDTAPGFDLPIGFAGGLIDTATGLIRFGLRDYDPQAGRWTARDPLLFGGGQANLYGYVNNNPINFRDPTGLFCIGVSAYAGFGGGAQTCITKDGASLCGEVGLGVGVDAGIDNGGLEPPGSEIGFEGKAKAGPVGIGAGIKFDECGLGLSAKGELGPVAIELNENLDLSKAGLQPDIEELPGSFLKLGRVQLQAKLYGKICTQGKW